MALNLHRAPIAIGSRRHAVVVRSHPPERAPVPPNVTEARQWIQNWKNKQMHNVTDHKETAHEHAEAAHAKAPAAASAAPQQPSNNAVAAPAPSKWGTRTTDGTVVFTAAQLKNSETSSEAWKSVAANPPAAKAEKSSKGKK
mmetsp:Transcript_23271/g.59468  ORF Transcript_23271/g.59468 Transcript_23271/m.59468 type:complete len:142 (-) Transcript_23271:2128-2553(-)